MSCCLRSWFFTQLSSAFFIQELQAGGNGEQCNYSNKMIGLEKFELWGNFKAKTQRRDLNSECVLVSVITHEDELMIMRLGVKLPVGSLFCWMPMKDWEIIQVSHV